MLMKVLWITNILLPEAAALLSGKHLHKGSGGWLMSSADALVKSGEVELYIVSISSKVNQLTTVLGQYMTYYVLPYRSHVHAYESLMVEVNKQVNPDVVHIHGTEWPYGLAYMRACGSGNVVISIQGLLGVIASCYTDGLTYGQIISNITVRDIIGKTILGEKKDYERRADLEIEALQKAKHVIGRTSFDKKYVFSFNPGLTYHFCNESLRDEFYESVWSFDNCTPHTIFLSQANYPIKGLHQILKALPIVQKKYPDVRVRIAGTDITLHRSLSDLKRYSGYGKIIYKLICKYHLQDVVSFTGLLTAEEMVNELLSSNIYVCPSSCENSSNSIAEAQLLGVPCLASNRGGNPDMITDDKYGELYEFYDIQGLAEKICDIFESSVSYNNSYVRSMARSRHDKRVNLETTIAIYKSIMNQRNGE